MLGLSSLEFTELLECECHIWEVFSHISSNMLSAPFSLSSSGTAIIYNLVHMVVSHKSLRLSLLFLIFSFVSSNLIILNGMYLSLLGISSCSSLMLNTSSDFLFSIQLLHSFAPDFLFGSLSLLIFSLCSYVLFLILFSWLCSLVAD